MPRGRRASVLLLFVAVTAACGERPGTTRASSHDAAPASARATEVTERAAPGGDAWDLPEVVRRLQEAGLVVSDSGESAHRDAIGAGQLLHVSGGALELYFYPTPTARRRASDAIDTVAHRLPSIETPHFIFSGNLIAVLTTPKEALAERVENVLTARHNGGAH